jgi:hypothetical protein
MWVREIGRPEDLRFAAEVKLKITIKASSDRPISVEIDRALTSLAPGESRWFSCWPGRALILRTRHRATDGRYSRGGEGSLWYDRMEFAWRQRNKKGIWEGWRDPDA